jgi:hypothetical protein
MPNARAQRRARAESGRCPARYEPASRAIRSRGACVGPGATRGCDQASRNGACRTRRRPSESARAAPGTDGHRQCSNPDREPAARAARRLDRSPVRPPRHVPARRHRARRADLAARPPLGRHAAGAHAGVVRAILAAVSLLALLGVRYPIQTLPLLPFELAWKTVWVLAIGLPLRRAGSAPHAAATAPDVASQLTGRSEHPVASGLASARSTWHPSADLGSHAPGRAGAGPPAATSRKWCARRQ